MSNASTTDARREQLEAERALLAGQVAGLEPGSGAGDVFDEGFADSGQVAAELGENMVLAGRLRTELEEVERALTKLDEGTYGTCEICAEPISEPRLEAMPATRFCIAHAYVTAGHLARRFLGSLRPGGPPATEVAWVGELLLPSELALWSAMPGPDRRHSAAVARRVEVALGPTATRPVLAAALLHDVGKTTAGLRTFGRVVATLTGAIVGRERAAAWDSAIGRYLRHDVDGARLLAAAGSDPLTVAWAQEHHLPKEQWTLPRNLAHALKSADDD